MCACPGADHRLSRAGAGAPAGWLGMGSPSGTTVMTSPAVALDALIPLPSYVLQGNVEGDARPLVIKPNFSREREDSLL